MVSRLKKNDECGQSKIFYQKFIYD
ncbi:hypothetical protein [Echinococcus multilocularis]|uniref:Uncharacterized protein n=1 Tax=Echinococcus multilocularis TaxID=6211 RepID=A0A0S4MIC7_ECHMU|nr:hypothetical protein [Echinococcus multilocularis]